MRKKLEIILLSLFLFIAPAYGQPEAGKFDEVGDIPCDEVKGRLDRLAIELSNNLTARAYIVLYGGKSYLNYDWNERRRDYIVKRLLPRRGEAESRISYWKPYLLNTRGIDEARIEVINGGFREQHTVEIWIAPLESKPPTLTPTLTEKEVKFRRGKVKRIPCEE